MNCLSCHQALEESQKDRVHQRCLKRLFGVAWEPKLNFGYSEIPAEAQKLVGKMSISGVQPKLSVYLNKKERFLEAAPSLGTYILKPSPEQWPHLAENENLCMNLAGALSIEVPPHTLLPLSDGQLVYVVRRFDRAETNEGMIKIHMEDFAQLLESDDKYSGSAEGIGRFLIENSAAPFIDVQKFFVMLLFNFLIGNGDAHLKNFAMVRLSQGYRLSPAYDIVNSHLALPNESEELAISVNGKRNRITKKAFDALAEYLEIPQKAYANIMETMNGTEALVQHHVAAGFLPQPMKERFLKIFNERFSRLFSKGAMGPKLAD